MQSAATTVTMDLEIREIEWEAWKRVKQKLAALLSQGEALNLLQRAAKSAELGDADDLLDKVFEDDSESPSDDAAMLKEATTTFAPLLPGLAALLPAVNAALDDCTELIITGCTDLTVEEVHGMRASQVLAVRDRCFAVNDFVGFVAAEKNWSGLLTTASQEAEEQTA